MCISKKSFLHNKFEIVVAFRLFCFLFQHQNVDFEIEFWYQSKTILYDKNQELITYEYIRLLCVMLFTVFISFSFLRSLFRVPIITKNRNNYRSPEIDILLVFNQLIIHALQAGIL